MFFAQVKVIVRSLRFRLMMWNALVMLIASLAMLWGLREGVRYTLLRELDADLKDDFEEISLTLVNVFRADNPFFHSAMDRKARGHKQRSWFLQVVDLRTAEQREADRQRFEDFWRNDQQRRDERGHGRRSRPGPEGSSTAPTSRPAAETATSPSDTAVRPTSDPVPQPSSPLTPPPSAETSPVGNPGTSPTTVPNASPNPNTNVSANSNSPTVFGGPAIGETNNFNALQRGDSRADNGNRQRGANGDPSQPRIIWQTFNVPDWSMLKTPTNFDRFILPDGEPTTVDHYRVLEKTVDNSRGGPIRIRIGASSRSIQHAAAITDRLMLLNMLVAVLIAPLGGYVMALRATKPLNSIIRTTERLRPQEMTERLPIRNTDDEIDQLSQAFNGLLDRVAEYLVKRQDLLANSAHELRTPLAALRSTAELALSTDRSVKEYCELLESIVSECGNLELLVNQLLLLSETESAHFESRGESVDFSKITSEACDMFGAVAESRGVHLKTEVSDGIMVDGSRLHLRQLLNNLIDNAIKFIPNDGQVTVQLNSTTGGQCLTVSDTGIGIAEAEQKRLFERFYRGDKARRRNTPTRGTGLGLSICRAIAEAHGGTITIQSQPGVGTQVSVVLPKPNHEPTAVA